jgi:polygalacturonase
MYNIVNYGAVGDGANDDAPAIQAILDGGRKGIFIPAGRYRITRTLRVDSFTSIVADPDARLIVCGETDHDADSFLLTNRDHVFGNASIHISGGIWDGNKQGRTNFKDPDLFNTRACTGTVLNFCNVRDLKLANFIVANSVVYFIRMCMLENFEIRDIGFQSDIIENNQDGLHFNGFVKNGLVENIRAITKGETNDDLIALNADDAMHRLENTGMVCGPIENIVFRNLYAEDCHTAIRMLSFVSPIRNIRFENVVAGCRAFAINMDAARYCRTPLFKDEDFAEGVGCVENIEIDGLKVWWSTPGERKALIDCESRVKNFVVRHFVRDHRADQAPQVATLVIDKTPGVRIMAKNGERTLLEKTSSSGRVALQSAFSELELG